MATEHEMTDAEILEQQEREGCSECHQIGPCLDTCPLYLAEVKAQAERYEEARNRRRFGDDTFVVRSGR